MSKPIVKPTPNQLANLRRIKVYEKKLKEEIRVRAIELEGLMLQVPQLPDDDVPIGRDDRDNVVVKVWWPEKERTLFNQQPKVRRRS